MKKWTVAEIKQLWPLLTLIWNITFILFARARAEALTEHFRSPGSFWWPKFICNQGSVDSGHPLNILLLGLPWINSVLIVKFLTCWLSILEYHPNWVNKWPFITLKAHGPHSVRTQMTDSNLALTQVANKLYKINFNIAFQSLFPSRVIFEKKNLSKNETLLNTGLLSYHLHTFWKISYLCTTM